MPVWLPVAAPEDPQLRIDQGDGPLTADELREVATSYDPGYRQASLICGYDPSSGTAGPSHFSGKYAPEICAITGYRFSEDAQELEMEIEPTDRLRYLFSVGYRAPSLGMYRFPDHPDGEPRWYGQHVALTGPGEVEIVAGLGNGRWAEILGEDSDSDGVWPDRLRAFNDDLSTLGGDVRYHRFRTLEPEEVSMPEKAEKKADKAPPAKAKPEEPDTKQRAAPPDKAEPVTDPKPKAKIRAVEADPNAELRQQIADQGEQIADLSETLRAYVEVAGDPAKIADAAKKADDLVKRGEARERASFERYIDRELDALSAGDAPRLRGADAEDFRVALKAMPQDGAEDLLKKLRSREPVATDLGTEFKTEIPENLPENFDIGRFRTGDGKVPSIGQIRQLAKLTEEGKGDPLAAAFARERAQDMRSAYNG